MTFSIPWDDLISVEAAKSMSYANNIRIVVSSHDMSVTIYTIYYFSTLQLYAAIGSKL
jgi:hypothetical protein